MFSRFGNILITILSHVPIHDFTSSFRAIRREVIESVQTESKGNSFFMEFIIKAHRKGYKITEIPIIFKDRVVGQSKLKVGSQSIRALRDLIKYTR
jgi:dolichol-phosphate mannosyltransferase